MPLNPWANLSYTVHSKKYWVVSTKLHFYIKFYLFDPKLGGNNPVFFCYIFQNNCVTLKHLLAQNLYWYPQSEAFYY